MGNNKTSKDNPYIMYVTHPEWLGEIVWRDPDMEYESCIVMVQRDRMLEIINGTEDE
jgi:hypothetical protein